MVDSSRISPDIQSDEAAIREWHRRYRDACNGGDLGTFNKLWDDETIWMPPNAPIIVDKKLCLSMAENLMKNYYLDQNPSIEEIKTDTNLAYSRVKYQETLRPKGIGEIIVNDGKCVFLFRRRSDGVWVATHCVWNSNVAHT